MAMKIVGWAFACILIGACAGSSDEVSEPLRGFDGQLVEAEPVVPSATSLPFADDDDATAIPEEAPEASIATVSQEAEPDEPIWLNPESIQRATAAGSRLIWRHLLEPYQPGATRSDIPSCPQGHLFVDTEQTATVTSSVSRGTTGLAIDDGSDGSLFVASATSYPDPSQVPAIADSYIAAFVECDSEGRSATPYPLNIPGQEEITVYNLVQPGFDDRRVVALHRHNLLVVVVGYVQDGDDAVFEEYVGDVAVHLNEALGQEEVLPEETA